MLESELLVKVARLLDQACVEYMLTGSFALQMYGESRMTRDIDIVIELSQIQSGKILHLFEKDFYINSEMIDDAMAQQSMFNIIHLDPVIKVDLILKKDDALQKSQFERRKAIEVMNYPVQVISPEDLLIAKLLWSKDSQSAFQFHDIQVLLSQSGDSLDHGYIQHWIRALDLLEAYTRATT